MTECLAVAFQVANYVRGREGGRELLEGGVREGGGSEGGREGGSEGGRELLEGGSEGGGRE